MNTPEKTWIPTFVGMTQNIIVLPTKPYRRKPVSSKGCPELLRTYKFILKNPDFIEHINQHQQP
jgi:hypothetical protein